MLKVIAEDFIKPEHVETVRPLYAELVRLTRQEPLCRAYDLFHFIFIEEWPDQAALDVHCASEHFRRPVPQIDAHQIRPGTYILMNPVPTDEPAQAASSASVSTVTP